MKLRALTLSAVISVGLGCAQDGAQPLATPTEAPAPTTACSEPRPQICTMDYRPVCGQHDDGSTGTYSNGCGACSEPSVVGHSPGACPD